MKLDGGSSGEYRSHSGAFGEGRQLEIPPVVESVLDGARLSSGPFLAESFSILEGCITRPGGEGSSLSAKDAGRVRARAVTGVVPSPSSRPELAVGSEGKIRVVPSSIDCNLAESPPTAQGCITRPGGEGSSLSGFEDRMAARIVTSLTERAPSEPVGSGRSDHKSGVAGIRNLSLMKSHEIVGFERKFTASRNDQFLIPAQLNVPSGDQRWGNEDVAVWTPRIVGAEIFSITDPKSGEVSVFLGWEDETGASGVVSLEPAETLRVCRLPSGVFGKGSPVAERLRDALDEWSAKQLVEPVWRPSAAMWLTPVCDNVASVVERLGAVQEQWHELMLGVPVRSISEVVGVDPVFGDVLGGIASGVALPGDGWIRDVKRGLEWGGVVFGVALGQPLIVNACVKCLVHDFFIEKASKEFGKLVRGEG
jgi:hypothetical protein